MLNSKGCVKGTFISSFKFREFNHITAFVMALCNFFIPPCNSQMFQSLTMCAY